MRPRAAGGLEIEAFRHRATDRDREQWQPAGVRRDPAPQAFGVRAGVAGERPANQLEDRLVRELAQRDHRAAEVAADA